MAYPTPRASKYPKGLATRKERKAARTTDPWDDEIEARMALVLKYLGKNDCSESILCGTLLFWWLVHM